MFSLPNAFFGPLDKGSCIYFLFFTILFFFVLVFALFTEIFWVIKNYKILNMRFVTSGVLVLFNIFIAYFVNRLLYTMCTKSLV